MDLRVFFYRKFVAGQGREKGIARKFLKKMRKSRLTIEMLDIIVYVQLYTHQHPLILSIECQILDIT